MPVTYYTQDEVDAIKAEIRELYDVRITSFREEVLHSFIMSNMEGKTAKEWKDFCLSVAMKIRGD